VRADVVYTIQGIERSDVPSLGMTQIIRRHLLDMAGIPLDRRRSILKKPVDGDEQAEEGEAEVRIIFIVRKDPWAGRIIVNHEEMVVAFEQLSRSYPQKLREESERSGRELRKVKIEMEEHEDRVSMVQSRKLFGRADIVIGPHGAGAYTCGRARRTQRCVLTHGGFVVNRICSSVCGSGWRSRVGGPHLPICWSACTAAHSLFPSQLFAGRHLNLLSTARLGLGYHAIIANTTTESTTPLPFCPWSMENDRGGT
jgi:hypothetical protein